MAVPGAVQDLNRLVTESVTYAVDGASIEAYVARPQEKGQYPGVIVIHEAFGPVEHIHDVARRFANQGYVAIAPNLYSRVGTPDPKDTNEVFQKMFGLQDAQVVRDLEGAAAYLRQSEFSNGKVGVIGFCSGGRQTLLMATQSTALDAAVDCWGGFVRMATPDQATTASRPTPVIDMVDGIQCPVFIVIGEEDQNPSPADGDALKERLEAEHKKFQLKIYHDAGHAFFADYRPHYREKAAFELWDDVNQFFHQYLK
ncbi:MAG: dienelactone hydrolase family protein [Firmicutes bacterium]|nr:dienelactone hydrolase family protein [Bacillota bacterium]